MSDPAPPDHATLVLLLARLSRLSEALVTEVCAAHDTTPAELRVLALLSHQPDGAGSPSDIARWVVQTSGGLTATLKRLEEGGHVERRPDPDDGRGRLVAITDEGRAAHDRVLGAVVDRAGLVLGDLDADTALAAVRDLVDAFERGAGLPSSHGFVAGTPVSPVGSSR